MTTFFRLIIYMVLLTSLGLSGCISEASRKHYNLRVWIYKINDGHGSKRPLFSGKDYYQLMAEALLDKHESVRNAAARNCTTGVVAAGNRYVYMPDAYIDAGRDQMLEEYLRKAYRRTTPGSEERLDMLESLVQLRMRQYLWAHPDFGKEHDIDSEKPQRGFGMFWLEHYPVFAEQILSEGDEEFARDWQEYRNLMKNLYGEDHDPAFYGSKGLRK